MSELVATNCACRQNKEDTCGNSFIFIILILLCCCGDMGFSGKGCGNKDCGKESGCGSIIWIILILCLCGGTF